MDINILVQNFIEEYGLISIFIIVMLEYANLPLPSEVVLPFVGIMVSKGNIGFEIAVIISIIGGLVGSITNYLLGLYFGKSVIKYLLENHPKTKESIKSSTWWIKKYGKLSVMLARVVPLARTFISIPAGMTKMNIGSFLLYSSIGISIWNIVLIYLGYVLGGNLHQITHIMKNYSIIMIILMAIGIATYYMVKKNRHKR
ncbi:DedA family protein [Faecalimicrobium sp. JNUCC 81]